jgi:hypothetical protein
MATFSLFADVAPEIRHYRGIPAGSFQIKVPLNGLISGDVPVKAALTIESEPYTAGDAPPAIQHVIGYPVDTGGEGIRSGTPPVAVFLLSAVDVAALVAERTYDVRVFVTRGVETIERVIRWGRISSQQGITG